MKFIIFLTYILCTVSFMLKKPTNHIYNHCKTILCYNMNTHNSYIKHNRTKIYKLPTNFSKSGLTPWEYIQE